MPDARFDVVGVGNAIVDVLAHADDDFIKQNQLVKGAMGLVDAEQASRLYDKMGAGVECSGGSAANTIAAIASLGGSAAFIGKIADDQLGAVFRHDMRSLGAAFETPPSKGGAPTAQCLVLVTPDAQRTMQTYLGACVELGPEDIDKEMVASAKVTYLEGYLWDPESAKAAFVLAAKTAHEAGRMVSLSLSDSFCVDRHRDEFLDFVSSHVDILFANEDEIMSLYRVATFDEALHKVPEHCKIAVLTRSENGSVVVSGSEIHIIDAHAVSQVVDTTGAGDSFAAGFLFGLTQEKPLDVCAQIGGIIAAEVISHMGARPDVSFKELIERKLG
jgi:sugar/nucleoside kinase (ribokinase family)